MDLFDIAAKISLDSKEFEEGMQNADSSGSAFASKLKSGLGTAAKVGGASIIAIGTAAVALGKKFIDGAKDVASYGDQIDKNSQKMGISAKAYQEWDFILQHNGSSIQSMSRSMMTLSQKVEAGDEAFQKLGITQEELATLNKEDLFARTIEGLQQMEAGTERDALAMELLGNGAKELGPLLNSTAEDVEEMRKQVNELGGVMSDDAVKASAAFQDSLQNLSTVLSGIKNNLLSKFLPSLTKAVDGLTDIFSGNRSKGLSKIKSGLKELVDNLSAIIPDVIEIGLEIVEGLAMSIAENLPMLMEKGADLILNGLLPGILEQLPWLIETAFSIIGQLATAIGQALPELIPAVIDIVLQIVDTLLSPKGIDILVDGAIQIVIGLANGIISALPLLLEKAPEIIKNFVSALIRNAPKMFEAAGEIISKIGEGLSSMFTIVGQWGEDIITNIWNGIQNLWSTVTTWGKNIIDKVWDGIKGPLNDAFNWGKDLIMNFWNGIKANLDWLWSGIKGIGQGIADFLGFSEPKKGPLSNFHTFAPDMMQLFMKGIKDNEKELQNTVASAFDFGDLIVEGNKKSTGSGIGGSTNIGDIVINVYAQKGQSEEEIGRIAARELQNMFDDKKAVFA